MIFSKPIIVSVLLGCGIVAAIGVYYKTTVVTKGVSPLAEVVLDEELVVTKGVSPLAEVVLDEELVVAPDELEYENDIPIPPIIHPLPVELETISDSSDYESDSSESDSVIQ